MSASLVLSVPRDVRLGRKTIVRRYYCKLYLVWYTNNGCAQNVGVTVGNLTATSASSAPFAVAVSQRVVSFSILCDLYRNDANGTNPFLPFFLEAIEKGTDPVERQYLVHLLCSPPTNRNVSIASSAVVVLSPFLGEIPARFEYVVAPSVVRLWHEF